MIHVGGCHCGALEIRLTLSRPAAETSVRECGCSFCRPHGARTASDPRGLAEITLRDPAAVNRYRFGTRTAEFFVCRVCGVYIAALADTERGVTATINVNTLASRAEFQAVAASVSYDGETPAARLARRAANWTPAIVRSDR